MHIADGLSIGPRDGGGGSVAGEERGCGDEIAFSRQQMYLHLNGNSTRPRSKGAEVAQDIDDTPACAKRLVLDNGPRAAIGCRTAVGCGCGVLLAIWQRRRRHYWIGCRR